MSGIGAGTKAARHAMDRTGFWRQVNRWAGLLLRARARLIVLAALSLAATVSIGLGIATALLDADLRALTLDGVAQPWRSLLFLSLGAGLAVWALARLNRDLFALLLPDRRAGAGDSLLNLVYERITSADKPRVVVFSSGIGLFIALNALKDQVSRVDVVLPMGEDIQLYGELLNANHLKLKNVFVAAVPHSTLCARFADGSVVEGFLALKEARGHGGVTEVFTRPVARPADGPDPASAEAESPGNAALIAALHAADAVIFGPTSLVTGVIAALVAPDVARAIAESAALKVLICPVMTEPGKTDGFSVSDHVALLERHAGFDLDYVLLNNRRISFDLARKYHDYGAAQVLLDLDEFEHSYLKVDFSHHLGEVRMLNRAVLIEDDLINASVQRIFGQTDEKLVVRHDPEKLRRVLRKVFDHLDYRRQVDPAGGAAPRPRDDG
jgi:uncharacterized cofD-like protein